MANITGILCQIITGRVDGAGTDGSVFLGIGGREFRLDSTADDYERGSWREYIIGRAPIETNPLPSPQIRVRNADKNDPRSGFPLDTISLSRAPVYLRFEPENGDDNWNLAFAAALVYTGEGQFAAAFMAPPAFHDLWMGQGMGKVLFLTNEFWIEPQRVLEIGRRIAAAASSDQSGA